MFALCFRDSSDCLVLVLSFLNWCSRVVSDGFQAQKRVRGSWVKSGQKESWQMRSRLMGERSGRANSVQNRMCGRSGVAGAVTVTSLQGCAGSTGRRSPRGRESGLHPLQRRAGRKTKTRSLEAENKELRARIDALEKKGGRRSARRSEYPVKERRRFGRCVERTRTSRMRPRAVKNWMSKKLRKELRDVERLSLISKEAQESIKESLQHQLQGVEKRRHDLMPEHQKVQKRSQKIQNIQYNRRN